MVNAGLHSFRVCLPTYGEVIPRMMRHARAAKGQLNDVAPGHRLGMRIGEGRHLETVSSVFFHSFPRSLDFGHVYVDPTARQRFARCLRVLRELPARPRSIG